MYTHIYGPYFTRGRHHLHLHLLDGTKKYASFRTEEEARRFISRNERRIVAKPIVARTAVETYLASRSDISESSRITLRFRLEGLFKGQADEWLARFAAREGWERLAKAWAVDTLHGVRSAATAFFTWAIEQGYIEQNPLGRPKIVGRKKRGKPQLRIDEARRFLDHVLTADGDKGRVALLGAATALLLGLRNFEVVSRQVRDLDDRGRVLWVPFSKTEAGIRRLEVSDVLRPHLEGLAGGRASTEQLFPGLTKESLRYRTKQACRELGLPEITPHGLRGTHATASFRPHTNPHEVAAALGHASVAVTYRHYARPEAVADARQEAARNVLLPPGARDRGEREPG